MDFKELFQSDISRYRNGGGELKWFHFYFRKSQTSNTPILKFWYRFMFRRMKNKLGIELHQSQGGNR